MADYYYEEAMHDIATSTDLTDKDWTHADGSIDATANRFGAPAWDLGAGSENGLSMDITSVATNAYVSIACWRKFDSLVSASGGFIFAIGDELGDGTYAPGDVHASIEMRTNGAIRVRRAFSTTVETLASGVMIADQWQHWEVRVFCDNSGKIELWVDEVLESTTSAIDTFTAGTDASIRFTSGTGITNAWIDDIIISSQTTERAQIGEHDLTPSVASTRRMMFTVITI